MDVLIAVCLLLMVVHWTRQQSADGLKEPAENTRIFFQAEIGVAYTS
jgi:hypothetical protein